MKKQRDDNYKAYFDYRESNSWDLTPQFAPPMISLPYGTQCNAKCTFCKRQSSPQNIPSDEKIPFVFERMNALIDSASYIYLSDWGEPSVAKYFSWICNELSSTICSDVPIGFTTNGTAFKSELFDVLLKNRPSMIIISLNAANREDYEHTMGVDLFKKIIQNIKHLVKLRANLDIPDNLMVFLSIVLTSRNYKTIIDFIKLAISLDVQGVLVEEFIQFDEKLEELKFQNSYKDVHDFYLKSLEYANSNNLPIDTFSNSWFLNPPRKQNEIFVCEEAWRSFRVGADGNVVPCCYFNRSFGNVLEQTPEEIWGGEFYQNIRSQWIEGNQEGACLKCINRWSSK